jgi:hypothetical protein
MFTKEEKISMIYVYDIEIFKNLFTATFVNVEDKTDSKVFVVGLGCDDLENFKEFLRQEMTLVGYNNHSYDDPILRFAFLYQGSKLNQALHTLSYRLIDDSTRGEKDIMFLRYPKPWDNPHMWSSIDLMQILAFDKLGISLKQTAINLKWHLIQDLPLEPDATVHTNELELVLNYNMNDVLITNRLYEVISPLRELRKNLSDLYGVNLMSASDSKIANILLGKFYVEKSGTSLRALRDLRTVRDSVNLADCLAPFIEFKDPVILRFFNNLKKQTVYRHQKYKYAEILKYGGVELQFGIGGLHSVDEAGVFVSDDEYTIQDADVASYYPNLIINNNFYPQHLGSTFIDVLRDITNERIAAKKAKDKVKADGLKITINSIFGKMGSETFWLLDAKQMLSTTLSGQMGLLMLIEGLHNEGIQVISCNTDGVVCRIKKGKMEAYKRVCAEWQTKTNLELEFTPYAKYVRRDVNSYITVKKNGDVKEKGAFLTEVDLQKAYHMPIVARALRKYFVDGIDIHDTITGSKDIMDFCISRKSDAKFQAKLYTDKGVENLQKTIRFFVSKKGGKLFMENKYDDKKKKTGIVVGRLVQILNKYDKDLPFENYDVDFAFYIKETEKILDLIEPKQITMFDMTALREGRVVENDFLLQDETPAPSWDTSWDSQVPYDKIKNLTTKNFNAKVKKIVEDRRAIKGIDPKYAYVMEYDDKKEEAVLFSFGKGTLVVVKLLKEVYKNKQFKMDDIIYCEKFRKINDIDFELVSYSIDLKFKDRYPTLF